MINVLITGNGVIPYQLVLIHFNGCLGLEPPELDLRDWILRHRAESPPREDSLDEISGAKEPSSQNSVKHHLTTASHRSRRGECEVPNVKEKWVFSRKNWEAVDEEEQVLLASETKKKQRTATSHQVLLLILLFPIVIISVYGCLSQKIFIDIIFFQDVCVALYLIL